MGACGSRRRGAGDIAAQVAQQDAKDAKAHADAKALEKALRDSDMTPRSFNKAMRGLRLRHIHADAADIADGGADGQADGAVDTSMDMSPQGPSAAPSSSAALETVGDPTFVRAGTHEYREKMQTRAFDAMMGESRDLRAVIVDHFSQFDLSCDGARTGTAGDDAAGEGAGARAVGEMFDRALRTSRGGRSRRRATSSTSRSRLSVHTS